MTAKNVPVTRGLPLSVKAPLWATGQIAVQVFRDLPSLLLLFYMTQVLTIPPALAGMAIFGPKLIWAIICDYSVGIAVDRWRSRISRRSFLLAGAIGAPAAMLLLFGGTDAPTPEGRALHIALMLTLYMLVFAIFSVPHLAIGTELGKTSRAGAVVMGWRIAFSGAGLIIGASLAPMLLQHLGGGEAAYRTVAAFMAAACTVALIVSWLGSGEETGQAPRSSVAKVGGWTALRSNRPFGIIFSVLILQLIASGLCYASLAYLFTYNLAYDRPLRIVGIFVLVSGTAAILSQPLWVALANRYGKRIGLALSSILFAVTVLGFTALPAGEPLPAYCLSAAMGFFNAGCYLNIYATLSDIVDAERRPDGSSRAGLYAGLFTAGDKVAFAIGGTLLTGSILGAAGFVSGNATQSQMAEAGITFAFAIVPATLFFITGVVVLIFLPRKTSADAQRL